MLLVVLASITLAARADDTDRTVVLLADAAIQERATGKVEVAQRTFHDFAEAWRTAEESNVVSKVAAVKAAECYLAFGHSTNAIVILDRVVRETGRSLPPQVPYLLAKSHSANGDVHRTIKTLEEFAPHIRYLPVAERQELALWGARASEQTGDTERLKRYLKEARAIAPESQMGKEAADRLGRLEGALPPTKH